MNIPNIITTMKKKIPILPLTINSIIAKTVYNVGELDEERKIAFYIYFPALCILCILWEAAHAYLHFIKVYPHHSFFSRIAFTIISTIIALWVFVTTAYYLGSPFSLFKSYSDIVAIIVLLMSFGFISLITFFEHVIWPKLVKKSIIDVDGE